MKNLLSVNASEGLCNCRIKFYPDVDGSWYPVQKMTSQNKIFNPSGLEKHGYVDFRKSSQETSEQPPDDTSLSTQDIPDRGADNRARLRARSKLLDLIRCNLDFMYFCTLTYNGDIVDRGNYAEVTRKFSQWCDNRVRRNGFKYVAVIERHKRSNGLHFHLLCNSALKLVNSGTVSVKNHKKPIKIATADRYNIPQDDRKIVYNISDWSYGFSTALEITGDPQRVKVAAYLQKYLTKDNDKIGGRWYYSGGDLIRPKFLYCDDDYREAEATYTIDVPCNTLKVLVL